MPVDPVTAAAVSAAITKTTTWLWQNYGQTVLEKVGKAAWTQAQWERSARQYLTNLHRQVSWLYVLGKPEGQPLDRIYTDINVLDKISASRWHDIEQLKAEAAPRRFGRGRKERRDGLAVARENPQLFILGKPGAGKTTFLKFVTLEAIKGEMEGLPIFVTLKALSDAGKSIMDFIVEQFRICDFPDAEPFVRQLLKDGRGLVLFDGLDEVNLEGNKRADLIRMLNDFIREFAASRMMITCRVAATDYSFATFQYVEMADFNGEQIRAFIGNWFAGDRDKRHRCWQAIDESKNETLRELAQVPLLLTLLCLVFEERNKFPPDRDEIYDEATRALLSKWDSKRGIERDEIYRELTLKRKQRMLARIAAETFDKGDYFLKEKRLVGLIEAYLQNVPGLDDPDGERVLKALEAQHGIFVERSRQIHSFSHLTLQEYYAARYIVENEARRTLPGLMTRIGDNRWRELFLLTAGMLDDARGFCRLYLDELQKMVTIVDEVKALLVWADGKKNEARSDASPAALRSFYLFLARALARGRALDPQIALDFVFITLLQTGEILAAVGEHTAEPQVVAELNKMLAYLREQSEEMDYPALAAALAGVVVPEPYTANEAWSLFAAQVQEIARSHRDLEREWALSDEQAALLSRYLQANLLFVECLKLAYVPDRKFFEDQILLPPQ